MCTALIPVIERCENLLDACVDFPDEIICKASSDYCFAGLLKAINDEPTNYYDRTMACRDQETCYPEQDYIETLLNQEFVQGALEIEKQTNGKAANFTISFDIIRDRYMDSGDFGTSSTSDLENIINHASVDVMIYVGKKDWIVTALGTGRMLERMRFNGYAEFRAQPKVTLPWNTKEGGPAGTVKKIDGLWFVELNEAGHLVSSMLLRRLPH
jgi:cathepsin A (carboxypeptidase C)